MLVKKVVSLLLSVLIVAGSVPTFYVTIAVTPTTYYIDTTGSNANNGTSSSTPWADFTNVNNCTFQPGDIVLLKRGCSWNQCLEISGSGTSTEWITIDAYGSGDMPKISRNSSTLDRCIWLDNTDYVSISNIEICNSSVGIVAYFTSNNHYGIKIKNCNFHDIYGFKGSQPSSDHADIPGLYMSASIFITGDVPVTASDFTIQDITVDNCNFYMAGDAVDIAGFNYDPNGQQGFLSTELGTHVARDITVKNCTVEKSLGFFNFDNLQDAKFISCKFDQSGYDLTNGCGGFFWSVANVDISNCIVSNQNYKTGGGGFFVDNAGIDFEAFDEDIKTRGCLIADNSGPGVEILAIATASGNFQSDHEFSSNTFMNNGKIGNTRYESGIWFDNPNRVDCSGIINDNFFCESTGLSTNSGAGNDSFTYDNNKSFADVSDISYAGSDFGITQGGNNWSYQYNDTGTYYNLNYDSTNRWWGNLNGNISSFNTFTSDDNDIWLCRSWEAPSSATISIRGLALKNDISSGDGVKIRITKNGSKIWPLNDPSQSIGYDDDTGFETNLDNVSVNQGDIIRFEVNNMGNGSNCGDLTSWSPSIGISGTVVESPCHTTITTSSEYGSSFYGTNAIDDNETTSWKASSTSFPQWLKYDLGKQYSLNCITTKFISYDTWQYKIEGSSDNSTWTTLIDNTGTGVSSQDVIDMVSGTFRYIKITITGSQTNIAGINEFKIFKDSGYITLLSDNKSTSCSSYSNTNYTSSKAVDSDFSSYWCASSGTFAQWLIVDLEDNHFLTDIAIKFFENDTWYYKLEGSTDNSNWYLIKDYTSSGVTAKDITLRMAGTYRYVKITITGSGYNWAAIREFLVFGSPNEVALLSQNKTTSCSSYSSSSYNSSKAVDGSETSYWCASSGSLPQWLIVDLGCLYELTNIRTSFYLADTWQYTITGSTDNSSWVLLTDSYNGGIYWDKPSFDDSVTGTYRYIKLTINKSTNNWVAINEFKVFGYPSIQSQNKTTTCSSYSNSSYNASKAVDNDVNSYWCAANGSFPQWLSIDLGNSYSLDRIVTDFYANETWKYKIEGSNDETNWTILVDKTVNGVSTQEILDSVSGLYRYVKITITDASIDWAAIREISVWGY